MKKFHEILVQKYSWYSNWHKNQNHKLAHLSVVVILLIFTSLNVYNAIARSTYGPLASTEVLAQVNGMRLLKEGEYAIIIPPGVGSEKSKNTIKQSIAINGNIQTFNLAENEKVEMIGYQEGSETYISTDAPGLTIYSANDFNGYDGKIDTAIYRALEKKDKVSVIIKLNLPQKFYDLNDTYYERQEKSKSFNRAKSSVSGSLGFNGRLDEDLKIINGISAEINRKALDGLSKNPNVSIVELDREVRAVLDVSVGEINAPYAWTLLDNLGNPLTGTNMKIAVIDTGVDYTHADLGGCLGTNCKVIGGYDFVNGDSNPMDDQGHGTHVAATAAGNGLLKGVAPDAKILAYKVLNSSGSGPSSNIIAAINRATDPNQDGNPSDHADVISMSLGAYCGTSYTSGCGPEDSMSLAVDNASSLGVVSAIAAGNSGPSLKTVGSPGTARSAITVAAACKKSQIGTTCSSPIASFSSRGPVFDKNGLDLKKPDISAPGVLICAARWALAFSSSPTCFDSKHVRISGTSMATPHIAGVAALMKQANPSYTPEQIKQQMKSTATPLTGMTYNDQGAGEVNVKTAIPIVSKITTTPNTWNVSSDPTKKISSSSQNFTATSTDSSISSLSVNFVSPIPGVTFTTNKSTLSVSNLGTDTFTGTINIDNDVALAGSYTAIIYLDQNGEHKGFISIPFVINPTISVSVKDIDYGVDLPSLPTWVSDVKQVVYTNKRTDISQTINISSSSFVTGVSYQKSASSVVIAPNSSSSISTNFSVDNSKVANGLHSGTLTAKNTTTTIETPIKFAKFYVIVFQDANLGDKPNVVNLNNPKTNQNITFYPQSYPHTLFLNSPDTYNIMVAYSPSTSTSPDAVIVKDNITAGMTSFVSNRNDAKNNITVKGTLVDGTTIAINSMELKITNADYSPSFIISRFGKTGGLIVSDLDKIHAINVIARAGASNGENIYNFGGKNIGLLSDWNITNTISDLKKIIIQHDVNKTTKGTPLIFSCSLDGQMCSASYSSDLKIFPNVQNVYTSYSIPNVQFFARADFSDQNINRYFSSPYFDVVNGTRSFSSPALASLYEQIATPIYQNKIYNGLGPSIWFSKFDNTSSKIEIDSIWSGKQPQIAFLRQDYSAGMYSAIPYVVNKNGVTVISKSLPSYNPNASPISDYISSTNISSELYDFHASFPYQNHGKDMLGTVKAVFDTRLSDPNPPYISRLYYFGNNVRSDVYDSSATNRLEIDLNPHGGIMSNVTLEISADGGAYANVPISGDGVYSATLPTVSANSKVALRITAVDSSNNSLQYTFELPAGEASTPIAPDTTPPTVSIISPANGAVLAGDVAVSANATDNVAIAKVEFYKDSDTTAFATLNSAPYNTILSALSNGTHTVRAKAYDTSGNSATSSTISFTTSNDTIAPSVSITNPLNETVFKIGTTITISADASDNIGVTNVQFLSGGSILCTDTTMPYSCDWKLPKSPNKTYTLTARAYDSVNNVGTSESISIKTSR